MRRHRVVLVLAATTLGGGLLVGVLAGCSAGSSNSASMAGAQQGARPAPAGANVPAGGKAAGPTGRSSGSGAAALPSVSTGRQVIRTATINLTARDVTGALDGAERIATDAGGYLSSDNADDDSASATLSVPETKLDAVLAQFARIGTVTSQQQQSQDVTDQLVDVTSRIATEQASVDRVRELLVRANSISDIVRIEGELTSREADLEAMEHQQAELAGQVAMATVTVRISKAVPPAGPTTNGPAPGFTNGLSGGWHALGTTVRVALLVLGAVLPFLLVIGIPVLVVRWLLRRRRRGSRIVPPTETSAT